MPTTTKRSRRGNKLFQGGRNFGNSQLHVFSLNEKRITSIVWEVHVANGDEGNNPTTTKRSRRGNTLFQGGQNLGFATPRLCLNEKRITSIVWEVHVANGDEVNSAQQ
ncbi:hypothetical protein CEXT_225591 [Caerostris extrusa]|uniref:Uncharacterized protein n=1 Tax=Caerostris extrusa TaxID=172846 RepID=A0AAV4PK73_CAEEX|nr:hypothetical protein CEXT_225591 [Caerostris extrusa]